MQHNFKQTKFAPEEEAIIRSEISSLLAKQVIEPAEHEPGEIISNIFLRPKKDGSHRLILNLKELNQSVSYVHFKMETLSSILKLVEQNAFMAAVDLKDAYYSVPVCKEDRKYLRFWWDGQLYQFTCLPNGLSSAPRLFTKILKPPLTSLHKEGHIVSGYLDDLCLQGSTYEECITNVIDTIKLLEELGFVVHPLKSVLIPSQEIEILGFVINTVSMTVELTLDKKESLSNNCKALLSTPVVLIRELAQVIGKIVSSFPGVMHGPLYYRYLERDKTIALRNNQGDFDAYTPLSDEAVSELNWWINKVDSAYNVISHENPSLTITTDASHIGWGAVCDNIPTGGNWKFEESQWHINELETLAAFIGIKSFAKKQGNQHIRIRSDNTTCISAINHMGTSHSELCNIFSKQLWEFCIERNNWVSAAYIPGKHNPIADSESRKVHRELEWMINSRLLTKSLEYLNFTPEIDLFASRINHQFPRYVSYRPDPGAIAIDAFTIDWSALKIFAFPPFSVIPRTLQKIKEDKATGICVLPDWPTRAWYPQAMKMLEKDPVYLKPSKDLLSLPNQPDEIHPMSKNLRLIVCLLSGRS